MKKYALIIIFLLISASTSWAASFFQIEFDATPDLYGGEIDSGLPADAGQDFDFHAYNGVNHAYVQLGDGRALGLYIGSEFSLDFNLKLDIELGFVGTKYDITRYSTNALADWPISNTWNYYHYMLTAGLRVKGDFQVTHNISLEPYIVAAIAPVYMFSPSSSLRNRMDADLLFVNASYTFNQSNILDLTIFGMGLDFDFTRSSVEYTGSSKFLVGFSVRWMRRAVEFEDSEVKPKIRLTCLSGTVLF